MTTTKIGLLFLGLTLGLATMAWAQSSGISDETVYVVQPKPMILTNRFEFAVEGAYDAADNYVRESGMSGQFAYHLRENLSVSLNGTWLFAQGDSTTTSDLFSLKDQNGTQVVARTGGPILFVGPYARYYRKPWLASAEVQWSPLLGKISFHDFSLGLFQIFITAGAGATGLELHDIANSNAVIPIDKKWSFATTIGGGFRIYFANHLGVRLEIKDYIEPLVARTELPFKRPVGVPAADSSFYLSHSPLLQAGLSYVF